MLRHGCARSLPGQMSPFLRPRMRGRPEGEVTNCDKGGVKARPSAPYSPMHHVRFVALIVKNLAMATQARVRPQGSPLWRKALTRARRDGFSLPPRLGRVFRYINRTPPELLRDFSHQTPPSPLTRERRRPCAYRIDRFWRERLWAAWRIGAAARSERRRQTRRSDASAGPPQAAEDCAAQRSFRA
jgi:hypothetical protein